MTCLPGEHRDSLWHNHDHDPTTKTVSGVYYMHIPDDVSDLEMAGTELAPEGVEAEGRYFAPWKTGHWMIYPGKTSLSCTCFRICRVRSEPRACAAGT